MACNYSALKKPTVAFTDNAALSNSAARRAMGSGRKRPPKQRAKSDLPQKVCLTCHRPFAWRKKWARCWEAVLYCSERCRRNRA